MPPTRAVTIDFHDTLFICDDWFELEVRNLLPSFLAWLSEREGYAYDDELGLEAQHRYRELRRAIMTQGDERDAETCVVTVLAELGISVAPSLVREGVASLMRSTLGHARPRPGAPELVAALHGSGVRLGVVSNAVYHPFIEWALAAHDLESAFDAVVSSASCGYYKSRAEIYLVTLELLGVRPDRALHLGDSYRFDVLGAARAGLRTAWLDLKGEANECCRADLVVYSLEGLAPKILTVLDVPPVETR